MASSSEHIASKRAIYYTCSTGQMGDIKKPAIEYRVPSAWKPGKSRNKWRKNKSF